MKKWLKQVLRPLALCIAPQDPVLSNIFDQGYGHARSRAEQKPVDAQGQPIPWLTYPCIEYLNQLDLSAMRVFEWGSGNSSKWFARRCKEIISVESDQDWYNYVKQELQANQTLLFAEESNYAEVIGDYGDFDLIIVDALRRYDCAEKALTHLKPGGFILLDNSDWHPNSCEMLRQKAPDLIQVDFHGLGPCNKYTWTSSLFLSLEFRPKLGGKRLPVVSLAGLDQISKYDQPWHEKYT